jgi:hypothetical protein
MPCMPDREILLGDPVHKCWRSVCSHTVLLTAMLRHLSPLPVHMSHACGSQFKCQLNYRLNAGNFRNRFDSISVNSILFGSSVCSDREGRNDVDSDADSVLGYDYLACVSDVFRNIFLKAVAQVSPGCERSLTVRMRGHSSRTPRAIKTASFPYQRYGYIDKPGLLKKLIISIFS